MWQKKTFFAVSLLVSFFLSANFLYYFAGFSIIVAEKLD